MIYLFRIFSNKQGDYLEFTDKDELVTRYNAEKNPTQYDWAPMSLPQALKEETRLSKIYALRTMKNLGDTFVLRVIIKGEIEWYSPSNSHGIPSEYNVAVKFFTHPCTDFRLTTCHHEVFDIAKETRFKALSQIVIENILSRVRHTRCEHKLDRYLNMNLRKLRQYGIQSLQVRGSYLDVKEAVSRKELSCPFFSAFILELLDVCITKELELVGEQRVYEKVV